MARRIFGFAFVKWVTPLREDWKRNGVGWSLVASFLSFPIIYYWIGEREMRTEFVVAVSLFCGTIIAQIIRFLWLLLSAPCAIIKEQDDIIANLEKITDRKAIIGRLTELWTEGTNLRNRGEALMHQSRVDPWWEEHLEWRNKTKTTLALLDPNKANQWWTLGLYTPRRAFPHALDPVHGKRLQMFDAWLERLQEEINELEEE